MDTPPAAAASPVRLRLIFDRNRLLRREQRGDGLRRCWLLLRPDVATIGDLAAHVADRFRLGRSCPRGVILSMDGFTLPPFESTNIFRDSDVVRVKQKSCKNMIKHDDVDCVQDPMVAEKQGFPADDEVLAIEYKKDDNRHQEEEQGGHQHHKNATISHNTESIHTNSKRKFRDGDAVIPESSRKKKLKVVNRVKAIGCKEDGVNQCKDHSGSKSLLSSSTNIITEKANPLAETNGVLEGNKKTERNHQTDLNCEIRMAYCNAQTKEPQSDKKLESRSARRKKVKRRLKQEAKAKAQLEKNIQDESQTASDCPSSSNQDGFSFPPGNQNGFSCPQGNQNKSHVPVSGHKTDEESDSAEDIVPVVVRPGHIRFERAGEQGKSPANEMQGTFQWSAKMSKKKGQKWGMNNSKENNADVNFDVTIIGSNSEVVDTKINENGLLGVADKKVEVASINNSASLNTIEDEEKTSGGPLDFESLYPLTQLPKEGDLIAYRLVELSSSWCPELSSYRVGKVLIYDPVSLRIILLPIPEYPIISEERETEDESDMLVDMSPYKEDGSLEIECSSLVDVRLLKGNESAPAALSTPFEEMGKKDFSLAKTPLDKSNGNIDSQKVLLQNNPITSESAAEKTQKAVWEETSEVPNDKSVVQENGWGNWTPNPSTSAWSLRALRSSAIGPTVAILRGKNNQRAKPSNGKYGK